MTIKIIGCCAFILLVPALGLGVEDYLAKRQHQKGIETLEGELAGASEKRTKEIYFELARLYIANAQLYELLAETATDLNAEYYGLQTKKKALTLYTAPLAGVCQLEKGHVSEATACLDQALKQKNLPAEEKLFVKAWLGAAQFRAGQVEKAVNLWAPLESSSFAVRTELAYIWARLGYRRGECLRLVQGPWKSSSPRVMSNVLYVLAMAGRVNELRDLARSLSPASPIAVENPKTLSEIMHFDPRTLRAIAAASLLLGQDRASRLDSVLTPTERDQYPTAPVHGMYALGMQEYGAAASYLKLDQTSSSLPALIFSLKMGNRKDEADHEYSGLMGLDRLDLIAQYGLLCAKLGDSANAKASIALCHETLAAAKKKAGGKRYVPQICYTSLGAALVRDAQYDQAVTVMNEGYRMDAPENLAVNDPELILWFARAMILQRNYRTVSEITRMMQPLLGACPGSIQVSECVARIDILTNAGLEGRSEITR